MSGTTNRAVAEIREHNQHAWCLFKNASAPENSIAPHWFVHFQRRDLPLIPAAGTRAHAEQVFLVVINSTGYRPCKQTRQRHDVLQRCARLNLGAARPMGLPFTAGTIPNAVRVSCIPHRLVSRNRSRKTGRLPGFEFYASDACNDFRLVLLHWLAARQRDS